MRQPAAQKFTRPFGLILFICHLLLSGVAAIVMVSSVSAASNSADPVDRPKIGLVLGGGGAKGAAHIGVLRVLEEMRIPIDCVAGTSMGALVGATFAAGVPPAKIETQVLAVDWAKTVGNAGDRDEMPISRKLESQSYTNSLDVGVKDGKLRGSGGFLDTQSIDQLLRTLVAGARYIDDFDELPIPFRAVATDMVSGDMAVLGEGDLSVAMRASMAVPGAFTPVILGDQVLTDGGQMRNVPVDIARNLCGDVMIVVSLATPPPTAADLTSALALAGRSVDVMIEANSRAQLATLTDKDVSIVVQMGDIGAASFDRVPDAIPLGRNAALAHASELARYSIPAAEYDVWRAGITRDYLKPLAVKGVTIAGLERVNPEYVEQAIIATKANTMVAPEDIAADSERIAALGDFETVSYRITDKPEYPTVEFIPVEKSWGPDFIDFDGAAAFSSEGDIALLLRVEHQRKWINSLGGEWRNTAQIGTDLLFKTSLYQPLDVQQKYFVEPYLRVDRYYEDAYDNGERVAEFDFVEGYGQADIGVNFDTRAQLRVGLRQSWNRVDLDTGMSESIPEIPTTHESNVVVLGKYDTRDAVGLPSKGNLLVGRYISSNSWLDGEASYDMAEALAMIVLPFRGDALNIFGAGGMEMSGELPVYRRYRIGGINSFPGLQRQQLRGDSYWIAGTKYNWKLAEFLSLFDTALYAGARITTGKVGGRLDNTDNDLISGIALTLGGRTLIGPFLMSLGVTDDDSWALQLALGRPIREGSIMDEIW